VRGREQLEAQLLVLGRLPALQAMAVSERALRPRAAAVRAEGGAHRASERGGLPGRLEEE